MLTHSIDYSKVKKLTIFQNLTVAGFLYKAAERKMLVKEFYPYLKNNAVRFYLQPDPTNANDKTAVKIMAEIFNSDTYFNDKFQIGWVPKEYSTPVFNLLAAESFLKIFYLEIPKDSFQMKTFMDQWNKEVTYTVIDINLVSDDMDTKQLVDDSDFKPGQEL